MSSTPSKASLEWKVGSKVIVSTSPGETSIHSASDDEDVDEAGVIVALDCEYEEEPPRGKRSRRSATITRKDGILVKLQISNTRKVFPPDKVKSPDSISFTSPSDGSLAGGNGSGSQRRSRRARVTPSPVPEASLSESTSMPSVGSEPRKKRPMICVEVASGAKKTKKTRGTETKDAPMEIVKSGHDNGESGDKSVDLRSFRVQSATTSASKCKHCKEMIRKGTLRLQPFKSSAKKQQQGWYHVVCVKEAFAPSELPLSSTMEGYQDLSVGEQGLLKIQLDEASPSETILLQEEDDDEEGEDPPLASLKSQKQKKAAVSKKKAAAAKRKSKSKDAEIEINDEDDDDMLRASDTDSDDMKDMPFRVEYSATSRAACKGCDEKIQKGTLRVAERPLFRGKPGFTVYRHLHCTVFSEQIERLQDVGGWRRLRKADRATVTARVEESKFLVEKENQELQPDELVQVTFQGKTLSPPKGLVANLLPFQVEGMSWMTHQEVHIPEIRGGILADEMGMGKTLQTITTILHNRPKLQHAKPGAKHPPSSPDLDDLKREDKLWKESLGAWKVEMEKVNVPKKILTQKVGKKGAPMGARGGTLVICPVIALYQWREEIKKFTDENALTVCCYHGPNRAKEFPREIMCKYDVVLTTYQVIEADFRKMVSPNKVKCPNCGGSFKIDKLRVHLKYFCGESAQRTEAQARQRRTADRHAPSNRGGGGGGGGKRGKGGKKKMQSKSKQSRASSTQTMKPPMKAAKKTVRAKKSTYFDSDSDLSVAEDLDLSSPRPTRSAASSATKRLSASAKEWGGNNSDSDSGSGDFSVDESSSEDEDSDDEGPMTKIAPPKRSKGAQFSSESESDDDRHLARARRKQAAALANAKSQKKKGKAGPKKGRAGAAQRKKAPEYGSSDDGSSSSDDDADRDPLDGIDLDKLMQEALDGSRASVVHTMCWWRVVLDEAHMIKSRSSQTAAAAFALTSIHRWCLSGTPLQNRVGELYSLIRFLRIDPMAHYFCRKEGCGCKSVHYRMLHGRCLDCGCGTIQHYSHFNKHVLNPIQRAGYQGDGRRAMMKLKDEVLDKCLIRRTKQTRAEDMNLPPRVVNIRTIRLHPVEEDFYNALYTQTKSSFDDYVTEGTLLNNYAHIFDLLTKMRQAVDHPYLIVYSKKNAGKFSLNKPAVANGSVDCDLCHEPPTDRVVSSCCGSGFCRSCVIDYMSAALEGTQQNGTRCPSCRAPFTVDLNQATTDVVDDGTLNLSMGTGSATEGMPSLKEMTHVSSGSILRRINLAEFATSTKIEALVQELVQMRKKRPGSKALVFSQFVNMLDLVRWRLHSDPCLHDLGLGVRIIHGGMNVQSRDEALKAFREDSSVRVLLMSLKAGGVALNLTVANEAYLLDPWWNPAAEMQAIDRTHRLGQYRPIRAVRFIAEGTVEERVLQLQEKKRLVFDGTVGRDAASLKMLTVDDMKAMFA